MDGLSYAGLGRVGVACRERGVSVCDEWVGSVGGGVNMYAGQNGVRRGENGDGDGGCSAHLVPSAVPSTQNLISDGVEPSTYYPAPST